MHSRKLDFVDYRGERLCFRDDSHKRGRHFSSTYHSPHDRIRVLGFFIISAYNSKFVLLLDLFLHPSLYGIEPRCLYFRKLGCPPR